MDGAGSDGQIAAGEVQVGVPLLCGPYMTDSVTLKLRDRLTGPTQFPAVPPLHDGLPTTLCGPYTANFP